MYCNEPLAIAHGYELTDKIGEMPEVMQEAHGGDDGGEHGEVAGEDGEQNLKRGL